MNASVTPKSSPVPASLLAFEAQAVHDGVLNAQGFFTQSDAEFELEALNPSARDALQKHLSEAGSDEETVAFLRSFMVDSKEVHFEPFSD